MGNFIFTQNGVTIKFQFMKKSIKCAFLIILSLSFISVYGQNVDWIAKTVTSGNNYTRAVTIEGDYVYAGGRHRTPSHYVSGKDSLYIPQWYGSRDIYFAKYEKETGRQIFVKHFGTSKSEQVWNMISDGVGGIYIQGEYFDSLNLDGKIIYGLGKHDSFLAKFDTLGNCLWLKGFSSPNGAYINDLQVKDNKLYVAGGYTNKLMVYNNNDTMQGGGGFIQRYSLNGNFEWGLTDTSKSAKGTISFQGISIEGDNIYFTGGVNYLTKLGDFSVQATNNQWGDFIIGCIENERVMWVKHSGTSYSENAVRIVKSGNNLFVAGTFTGKSEFLGLEVKAGDTIGSAAQLFNKQNIFILKTDINGNPIFIESVNSSISRFGGLRLDYNGTPWINGIFQDSTSIQDSTYYSIGGSDMFIAKINEMSISKNIFHFGGNSLNLVEPGLGDRAHDLDFDKNSNSIYVTGAFSGSYNFSGLSGKGHFNNNHYGVLVKFDQEVDLTSFNFSNVFCQDSSYQFVSPYFSDNDTVEWFLKSDAGTLNIKGRQLNFNPIDTGVYNISLIVKNNFSNDSIYKLVTVNSCALDTIITDTTSFEEQFFVDKGIYIFPNPTQGILNFQGNSVEKVDRISVFNSFGELMINHFVENDKSIDLSDFSDGFYCIKLYFENNEMVTKQIVKF